MKITVDKRGLLRTQREVARLNGLLIEDHVETPCSMEIVEKSFVPVSDTKGHTRHVVDISLPRLNTGSHTVWAFAHSNRNKPGKFNSFYIALGAPEEVRLMLNAISVADCDHCNLNRNRLTTYVVQDNETGMLRQVGSSCLADFTGLKSKSAHDLDSFKTLFDSLDGQVKEDSEYIRDAVLATALAVVEDQGGYQKGYTAEAVREHLEAGITSERDVEDFKAHVMNMYANDYIGNVQALMEEETVFEGQLNMLISSATLAPRGYTDEYVGEVDEKVKDAEITVVNVNTYDDYSRISGVDEKNRQVTWFKSHSADGWGYNKTHKSSPGLEFVVLNLPQKGEAVKVSSARVKRLSVFNGEKQTQLSHVRIKKDKAL